jgi:hypothetical protein
MLQQRTIIKLAVFGISLSISACSDNNIAFNQTPENRPPKILISGDDYNAGSHIKAPLPQLWVVASDPDGADDIAAVVLKISNISLVSLIVRPDDSTQECSRPFYAPMDTINVLPFLKKQRFSVPKQPLRRGDQGAYSAFLSYDLLTEGGISQHADEFGQGVKFCRWGYDYLYMIEQFGLYPPALPSPRDVYVTYTELFLSGISITAYDQSGASVAVTFPDFYAVFTNTTEDQTPP